MQAILYVGHGSRVKEAAEEAKQFLNNVIKQVPVEIQETCFLELARPSIKEGVEQCVKRGATEIAVVPVLLLTATHAKEDIPEELKKVKDNYPEVTFTYGRPIGVHNKLVDVLMERIVQKVNPHDLNESYVLLVGRGSSDQEQINDFNSIAVLLKKRTGIKKVETCFLAAAQPSLEEGLQIAQKSNFNKVIVLPYLLFTGILMQEIEEKLQSLSSQNQEFILCDYLGYHPYLEEVLIDRVNEVKGNEQFYFA